MATEQDGKGTFRNGFVEANVQNLHEDIKEIKTWMASTNGRIDKLFYLIIGSLFGLVSNFLMTLLK